METTENSSVAENGVDPAFADVVMTEVDDRHSGQGAAGLPLVTNSTAGHLKKLKEIPCSYTLLCVDFCMASFCTRTPLKQTCI